MGIVSVCAALFEILLNEKIREMMDYRHIATENHIAGVYKNIFYGAIYRNIYLNERTLLQYLGQVKM
jgi:hypothetical protein